MRFYRWVLSLALAGIGGCGGSSVACTTSDACPAGLVCVDNECRSLAPDADGGPRPDAGLDAGRDAGPDAGPDGAMGCARGCGEVDVDGDGSIDEDDLAALPARYTSDACMAAAADVNRDDAYDEDDEHALRAIASGRAIGVCEACGACGDVDGDGEVNETDAALAAAAVETTPTSCTLLTADLDRDGVVALMDARIVRAIAEGRASAECAACDERACGDANGDGATNVLDVVRIANAAMGGSTLTPCEYAVADVVRDGIIDRRDAHAASQIVAHRLLETELDGACEECPFDTTCGDVDGDGVIGIADPIAIGNVGMESPPNVCRYARADLNADGQVNARDAYMVLAIFRGLAEPAERCPTCTLGCGDVNQDGGVSGGDLVRFSAIRGGARAPLCERDAADVNGDGDVDARDERLLSGLAVGTLAVTGACPVCTGVCGDLNRDGMVTASDRGVVTNIETSGRAPTPCELDDGDIDHDGDVDAADRDLITAIIGGTPPPMPCGR